jgi:hypothetical protein
MTKGRVALPFRFDVADDEQQISPLRYASVGMTKGRVAFPFRFDAADNEQQIPPLRYALVGMTKGGERFHSDSMLRMMNSRSLHYATLRSG